MDNEIIPTCAECDKELIQTSVAYGCCPDGHGRLIRVRWQTIARTRLRMAIARSIAKLPAVALAGRKWVANGVFLRKTSVYRKGMPIGSAAGKYRVSESKWATFEPWEAKNDKRRKASSGSGQ